MFLLPISLLSSCAECKLNYVRMLLSSVKLMRASSWPVHNLPVLLSRNFIKFCNHIDNCKDALLHLCLCYDLCFLSLNVTLYVCLWFSSSGRHLLYLVEIFPMFVLLYNCFSITIFLNGINGQGRNWKW